VQYTYTHSQTHTNFSPTHSPSLPPSLFLLTRHGLCCIVQLAGHLRSLRLHYCRVRRQAGREGGEGGKERG